MTNAAKWGIGIGLAAAVGIGLYMYFTKNAPTAPAPKGDQGPAPATTPPAPKRPLTRAEKAARLIKCNKENPPPRIDKGAQQRYDACMNSADGTWSN